MAGNDKTLYRGGHRPRIRVPGTLLPDWDFLQALLAFAFTVQQENQKLKGEISRLASAGADSAEDSQGIHIALTRIVASAQNLTAASGAALALGTEESMVCVARSGRIAPEMGSAVALDHGLAAECARTRQSVLCVNAGSDPRVDAISSRVLGVRSMLYVPLQAQDELIGILGLFSDQASHFASSDLQLLRYIAALVLEQLHKKSPLLQTITPRVLVETIKSAPPAILEKEPDIRVAEAPAANVSKPLASAVATVATAPRTVSEPRPAVPALSEKLNPAAAKVVPSDTRQFLSTALPDSETSSTVLIGAVLFVLFTAVLGGGYYMRHHAAPIPARQLQTTAENSATAPVAPGATPTASLELGRSLMPGVRYWISDGRAMVTIAFDHKTTYESGRLHNPDRIYFDLHGFDFEGTQDRTFNIDDALLRRIRVGRSQSGVTRLVFDLSKPLNYSASETSNPAGLVIEFDVPQVEPGTKSEVQPESLDPVMPHALTVVIDPGHGGRDTGTIGHNGLQEKQLTLDVARRLGKLLEQELGAHVLYTRRNDHYVSLEKRSAAANKANADFFISIHANSSQYPSVNGVETYYFKSSSEVIQNEGHTRETGTDTSERAKHFAAAVQSALIQSLSSKQVAVRDRGVRTAPFVVLRDMHMPAVLAEISFISSETGERELRNSAYRDRIANALYRGIANSVIPRSPDAGSVAALSHGAASAP